MMAKTKKVHTKISIFSLCPEFVFYDFLFGSKIYFAFQIWTLFPFSKLFELCHSRERSLLFSFSLSFVCLLNFEEITLSNRLWISCIMHIWLLTNPTEYICIGAVETMKFLRMLEIHNPPPKWIWKTNRTRTPRQTQKLNTERDNIWIQTEAQLKNTEKKWKEIKKIMN